MTTVGEQRTEVGDRLLWRVAEALPAPEEQPWMVLMSGELNLTAEDVPKGVALVEKPFEMPEMIDMLQRLVTGAPPAADAPVTGRDYS